MYEKGKPYIQLFKNQFQAAMKHIYNLTYPCLYYANKLNRCLLADTPPPPHPYSSSLLFTRPSLALRLWLFIVQDNPHKFE